MDLREICWGGMDWIDLGQDRALLNMVINFRVPKIARKFLSSCTIVGFSRRAQLHEIDNIRRNVQIRSSLNLNILLDT
jgi:hypothetical protein